MNITIPLTLEDEIERINNFKEKTNIKIGSRLIFENNNFYNQYSLETLLKFYNGEIPSDLPKNKGIISYGMKGIVKVIIPALYNINNQIVKKFY